MCALEGAPTKKHAVFTIGLPTTAVAGEAIIASSSPTWRASQVRLRRYQPSPRSLWLTPMMSMPRAELHPRKRTSVDPVRHADAYITRVTAPSSICSIWKPAVRTCAALLTRFVLCAWLVVKNTSLAWASKTWVWASSLSTTAFRSVAVFHGVASFILLPVGLEYNKVPVKRYRLTLKGIDEMNDAQAANHLPSPLSSS